MRYAPSSPEQRDWSLQRVLDAADQATGTHVLNQLHDEYRRKPALPHFDSRWKQLGVIPHNVHE